MSSVGRPSNRFARKLRTISSGLGGIWFGSVIGGLVWGLMHRVTGELPLYPDALALALEGAGTAAVVFPAGLVFSRMATGRWTRVVIMGLTWGTLLAVYASLVHAPERSLMRHLLVLVPTCVGTLTVYLLIDERFGTGAAEGLLGERDVEPRDAGTAGPDGERDRDSERAGEAES